MRQNIYLYFCEKSGEGVLIDAGCDSEDIKTISSFIRENNITVKGILLTHGHYDHIISIDELKKLLSALVYSHEAEKVILEEPSLNLSTRIGMNIMFTPDKLFNDGDVFKLRSANLKVLHTPGHTTGGL